MLPAGLMATAQIALIARDLKVVDAILLLGRSTLTIALLVANGGARPLFGSISDQIGREYTMAIAFVLGGKAIGRLARQEQSLRHSCLRRADFSDLERDIQLIPVNLHR